MALPDTVTARPAPGPSPPPAWTLRLLFSGGTRRDSPVRLPTGDFGVGREGPDLALPDDACLSRRHAVFKLRRSALTVHDAGSHNGTWVDGRRIQRAALADGSRVRCGDSLFLVRHQPPVDDDARIPGLVGDSPELRRLRSLVARVAPADVAVLLLGPTGSGKGAVASALHARSARADGPLVTLDLATLPAQLAESTLYGHARGAFTGAIRDEPGRLRSAHGGTLFLDELGELPLALQPTLLQVLDEGVVTPVGAHRPLPVDARVIAATNVDLQAAVASGAFRADLYARLAAVVLRLPPLAGRREDVLPLLEHFLGGPAPLTADLAEALVAHAWPLNVREVQRIAEHLRTLGGDAGPWGLELVADRLQLGMGAGGEEEEGEGRPRARLTPDAATLRALLEEHHGVVAEVARAVGRSPRQVYRWLGRAGIDPEDHRR